MQTNNDRTPAATTTSTRRHRRTRTAMAGIALILAAGVIGACDDGGVETTTDTQGDGAAVQPLDLSLGDGDPMASCLAVDAETLSQMSPAFLATVTDIAGETVTLEVDTWYAGEDPAETVQLHAQQGLQALIGGIDFQLDEKYLITAADGSVNYCGYSGPADATLTALFEEAFAS